jgi:hypothetical protein
MELVQKNNFIRSFEKSALPNDPIHIIFGLSLQLKLSVKGMTNRLINQRNRFVISDF